LENLARMQVGLNKNRILDDIWNPLPNGTNPQILNISNRGLLGWELEICEPLAIVLMFVYQLPVI